MGKINIYFAYLKKITTGLGLLKKKPIFAFERQIPLSGWLEIWYVWNRSATY
jgi:hypothetical protein